MDRKAVLLGLNKHYLILIIKDFTIFIPIVNQNTDRIVLSILIEIHFYLLGIGDVSCMLLKSLFI